MNILPSPKKIQMIKKEFCPDLILSHKLTTDQLHGPIRLYLKVLNLWIPKPPSFIEEHFFAQSTKT